MHRYEAIATLGDGSYGLVRKAAVKESGEIVAIKTFKKKFPSWNECLELREVKALQKLKHPNIVRLREMLRENDELFMVFEFCEGDLHKLVKDPDRRGKVLPEGHIREIMRQVFGGLAYMHKHGFFHRDMKPENLLFRGTSGDEIPFVKICDFGLAREVRSRPPYTEYVSTRWYRSPELLLKSTHYNSPIDIWAAGAIFAELYLLRPLFPGTNENDQLFKICSVLGTPTAQTWNDGVKLAAKLQFSWPQAVPTQLKELITGASPEALAIMEACLRFDPSKRPSAVDILNMPYFANYPPLPIPAQVAAGPSAAADAPASPAPPDVASPQSPSSPPSAPGSAPGSLSENKNPSLPSGKLNSVVSETDPSKLAEETDALLAELDGPSS
eukprot:NODE_1720_length_1321_cov_25.542453_g1432_i0.p1 GENE.NODE_1720_length_1321_cov_25.542453_g1432_i0~~NODE_1720_length_1321_cov_25.542453_g1432_i0.p1  ORF type:complete len:385 (+),score=86.29 NODE_1720_length_1321_cov_25.542453_g1432_i0:86-1240(+)